MKIRTGFVSNSSSSSYVCDICGSVYDDNELLSCEHGHMFCEDHLEYPLFSKEMVSAYIAHSMLSGSGKRELIHLIHSIDPVTFGRLHDSLYSDSDDPVLHRINIVLAELNYNVERWEIRENLPPEYCPFCTFEKITDHDLIKYFIAFTRMSRSDVFAAVKRRFNDYESFKTYLHENQMED